MRVLIACERSGVVREHFRSRGHVAWSCDLASADDGSRHHYQRDIMDVIGWRAWDLLIAHPPCTYLSASGLHWTARGLRPLEATEGAVEFVYALLDAAANVPMIAIENPIGYLSRALRPPDQIIQPYDFGDDASKATCLWLKGLPPLKPTRRVAPRMVNGRPRWANQTDSGQNKLPPSERRAIDRARTYPGIAAAMAEQWGALFPRDGGREG